MGCGPDVDRKVVDDEQCRHEPFAALAVRIADPRKSLLPEKIFVTYSKLWRPSLSILVIALLSRGGMGGGDVKLAAAAGAFLGLQYSLLGLLLAFIFGALVGLVLMALGKKRRKDYIPFAPFIAAGCLAA